MKEKGSVVILVAFTIIIIFFLGTALIDVSSLDFRMANNQVDQVKAYYIAEAGMKKAVAKLKTDITILNNALTLNKGQTLTVIPKESFGGGSFYGEGASQEILLTMKEKVPNQYLVVALSVTGSYQAAIKNIQVIGRINMSLGSCPLDMTTALLSGATTIIDNNAVITGSVFSQGAVTIENNAKVYGNVTSGAGITVGNNGYVSGSQTPNSPELVPSWPTFTVDQYQDGATVLTASSVNLANFSSGKYFFPNNVTVSGTYNGKITLISNGNITINNNVIVKALNSDYQSNALTLISFGNIIFNNNAIVEAVVFAAGDSSVINFSNNSWVKGAIIGKNISFSNNAKVDNISSLVTQFTGYNWGNILVNTVSSFDVLNWR